ncbi:MAG: TonB-dependent receptor [Opitutaceae bacterium]|nr:TonB-dependent receptor [Opitutaceae bacterium]
MRSLPLALLHRARSLRAAFLIASLTIYADAFAASQGKITFDLPAGEASQTLKQFAQQAQREILFPVQPVGGVQTNDVHGEFSVGEALDRLLSGTELTALVDTKTGAIVIKRVSSPNAPSRPAEREAAQGAETRPSRGAAGTNELRVVKLEKLEVTGTRLHGLLAGATAQPVLSLNSRDIDRTGAQSLGDLFRYIPQVSSFTLGQSVTRPSGFAQAVGGPPIPNYNALNNGASGRVTATLRGTAGDGTLLLVDGVRVPKNNQASGGDGYDLNGIPLAAIDRVEVLLDGASSIYGADAIGGVINIILKKNYRGSELRLGYENTFDRDAGVRTASITHGFGSGRLRGLATLSYEDSNSMALRDRALTASSDRRPFGGQDLRGTIVGGAGRVSRTGTVPLPGLTATSAAVPSGTSGTGLTVANYASSGPIPEPGDLAQFQDYSSEYTRKSAVIKLSYDFAKYLEAYTHVRAGQNRNELAPQPIQASLTIPAGYPGNPFGIPILLSKYLYDIAPVRTSINDSFLATLGVRGQLPRDWHYDASISFVRGHTRADASAGPSITAALFNAAVAAGQTPNLFYDSTRIPNPNAPGVIESLTTPARDEEVTEDWIYSAQLDGPVFTLPAGKIVVAGGVEFREEYTDFPLRSATDNVSARASNQEVRAFFSEVNVPVFAPAQKLPLLDQLNLSGSFRREAYTSGGSSSNPRGGVAFRPIKWLLLRGSYGTGFKVPTLLQTNQPVLSSTFRFSGSVDPLRGNEPQTSFITRTTGGNPNLRPEKSENTSFGFVLEAPMVKGLSFSVDWFDNKFIDRITLPAFEQMLQHFPERVTRGPNRPGDQAGWPGPVTAIDYRNVNLAYSEVSGCDVSAKYDRTTPLGEVLVNLTVTKYAKNVFVAAPNAPPSSNVNTDSLPVQVSGAAFLNRGAWGTGALATYRAASRFLPTVTATPSAIRWDWQFSYDFDKSAWLKTHGAGWLGRALKGVKASLTVFNVFNTEPPLDYLYLPDNTTLDARLRRYGLSLRKQF